jgi:hypothetical protein
MLKKNYTIIGYVILLLLSVYVGLGSLGVLQFNKETGAGPLPTQTPTPTQTTITLPTQTPHPSPSATPIHLVPHVSIPSSNPTLTPTLTPTPAPTPSPTPAPSSGLDRNWTIVDGTWNVSDNEMYGSSLTEALIVADNTNQTNYEVTMNTIITGGVTRNESSIVIRYVDANNFYWMGVGCFGHQYSIGRMLNGVSTEIASSNSESNVQLGVTYTIRAVANANVLTLYVNENQVLQIADNAFGSGAFGIRTFDSSIQVLDIQQH